MKKERFLKYIKKELDMINKAKYEEGVKIKHDPGNKFIRKWAEKNAKKFRKDWFENDIKEALHELDKIIEKTNGDGCEIIANIKEQLEEAMGLLEE